MPSSHSQFAAFAFVGVWTLLPWTLSSFAGVRLGARLGRIASILIRIVMAAATLSVLISR